MSIPRKLRKPRTAAQTSAARDNATLSHGPVSPEGKAASAANALKHGLYAAKYTHLLPGEDPAVFEAILQNLTLEFQPATPSESHAVYKMALAWFTSERLGALYVHQLEEASAKLALQADSLPADPIRRNSAAFYYLGESSRFLDLHHRCDGRNQRLYDRALRTLLTLQARREKAARVPLQSEIRVPKSKKCRNDPSSAQISIGINNIPGMNSALPAGVGIAPDAPSAI